MQLVILDALGADRLERSRADVQREERALDAARLERREQRGVEVQPRGRRRDRARRAPEHRLVALAVARLGRALDVRRQRHLAVLAPERCGVAVERELDEALVARVHARS